VQTPAPQVSALLEMGFVQTTAQWLSSGYSLLFIDCLLQTRHGETGAEFGGGLSHLFQFVLVVGVKDSG